MSTEPTPSSATPETESAAAPSSSGLPQAAPQAAWPERVETGEHQVSYRVTVAAPAHELWAMLADPHRHHEADGSGTVRPKVSGPHRLAVGDRFRVAMRKYGVPYTMTLTATAVDEDELPCPRPECHPVHHGAECAPACRLVRGRGRHPADRRSGPTIPP